MKNDNFSIICSNCIGGIIYNRLGKRFLSPTINLWMHQRDFIKFVLNLENYLDKDLVFVNDEYDYPVALIDDVKIYFNHSKDEESARRDWERRKIRINYDNLFIIMYDREYLTEDDLLLLNDVKCKNKIVLSDKERKNLLFVKTIKPNLDRRFREQFLDKDKYGIRTYEKQWDFVSWLNQTI